MEIQDVTALFVGDLASDAGLPEALPVLRPDGPLVELHDATAKTPEQPAGNLLETAFKCLKPYSPDEGPPVPRLFPGWPWLSE